MRDRKKLVLVTEVVRTLSSLELELVAGGVDWLKWLFPLGSRGFGCFGQSDLCHGPDSEAVPKQKS